MFDIAKVGIYFDFTRKKFCKTVKKIFQCRIFVLYLYCQKQLNIMKWNELIRLAKQNGWVFYRSGKKHDIYRKEGRTDEMQVGRHGSEEVKPGLMKKLLKQIEGE